MLNLERDSMKTIELLEAEVNALRPVVVALAYRYCETESNTGLPPATPREPKIPKCKCLVCDARRALA